MPIYEYQCPKCRHTFEEWVKASASHEQEPCPKCGEPSPRIMSQTSFVLKGGGWYVSDYGYRKDVKEEGEAKASSDAAASDAKPASAATDSPGAAEGSPAAAAPSSTQKAAKQTATGPGASGPAAAGPSTSAPKPSKNKAAGTAP